MAVIDLDVGVAVVEVQRRADVGPRRNRGPGHELGQVDDLRKVDACSLRQGLDERAVGFDQGERGDVDRVGEEVARRVGEADGDHARFIRIFAGVQAKSHGHCNKGYRYKTEEPATSESWLPVHRCVTLYEVVEIRSAETI